MNSNYQIKGRGTPFFFQHGLGANLQQPRELLKNLIPAQVISMDFRGHGKSLFTGIDDISFDKYADDLIALANELGIEKAIFGGISMGSGVALNVALRYPERVIALILVRPAWLDQPNPENLQIFKKLSLLIKQKKPGMFVNSAEFKALKNISEGAAQSVLSQLTREQSEHTADVFSKLIDDSPFRNPDGLKFITAPSLVLSGSDDPLHPSEFGAIIAKHLPFSTFYEVPSKYVEPKEHERVVVEQIKNFFMLNNLVN